MHTAAVVAEVGLARLLATMSPQQRAGRFVFVTVDERPYDVELLASVVETEGLSVVVAQEDADRLGLRYDFVAGWITLQVHSSLAAVGLTAVVSAALAEEGISCNVVAGRHHDHLLVPSDRVDEAVTVLRSLTG